MPATSAFLGQDRLDVLCHEEGLIPRDPTRNHHRVIGKIEHVFLPVQMLAEMVPVGPDQENIFMTPSDADIERRRVCRRVRRAISSLQITERKVINMVFDQNMESVDVAIRMGFTEEEFEEVFISAKRNLMSCLFPEGENIQ